jgi:hypothetical protein
MHCPVCDKDYANTAENCMGCGYPFEASKKEQSKYIGQMILKKSSIQDAAVKIKRARIALWVIGGFYILGVVILYVQASALPIEYYIPNLLLGVLFVGFGFLTFRLPIISTIIPLILLTAYWVFLISQDLGLFLNGILYKIAAFSILVYALYGAIEAKNLKDKNNYLNDL